LTQDKKESIKFTLTDKNQ